MTYRVEATAQFQAEYSAVIRYLIDHLKTRQAASSLMEDIECAIHEVADNPYLHAISRKPYAEQPGVRERMMRNYVVVYKIQADVVLLVHLFHQSQDFEYLL